MSTPNDGGPAFPATVIVYTVNGPVPCCAKHAQKLANLMHFMGAYSNETEAPDGAECNNCRNEAERNK